MSSERGWELMERLTSKENLENKVLEECLRFGKNLNFCCCTILSYTQTGL